MIAIIKVNYEDSFSVWTIEKNIKNGIHQYLHTDGHWSVFRWFVSHDGLVSSSEHKSKQEAEEFLQKYLDSLSPKEFAKLMAERMTGV